VDQRIRAQQVDKIFKAAALAANAARIPLAKLAIQGTQAVEPAADPSSVAALSSASLELRT
jgi:hypothetical protein